MKKILLVLTGSVSACQGTAIVRALQKENFEVVCILTEAARHFVGAEALAAISRNPVFSSEFFSESTEKGILAKPDFQHLELAKTIDALLIAPSTADAIFRLAHGSASGLAEAVALATRAPILVAPAMNPLMLENPAVQENLAILHSRGVHILPTKYGEAACGEWGCGKLLDPQTLAHFAKRAVFPQTFKGKKILITLGGTFEKIDSVRGISNRSSGKMGLALAEAFWRVGAEITLVVGKITTEIPSIFEKCVFVESAQEMREKTEEPIAEMDFAFFAAAVADFAPVSCFSEKIPSDTPPQIFLEKTPDIAAICGKSKKPGQQFFGFSLGGDEQKAREKMVKKNLDGIFWNPEENIGADVGEMVMIFPKKDAEKISGSKKEMAEKIRRACEENAKNLLQKIF